MSINHEPILAGFIKLARSICLALFCLLWLGAGPCPAAPKELSNQEVQRLVNDMVQAYEQVNDYTTILFRRGTHQEKLSPMETILFKFRKPFSVYMKWIEEPQKDRELIYVQGWNQGLCRISTGSFPDITLNLDPEGSHVRNESFGHTLFDAGIGFLVETLAKNYQRSVQNPRDGCKVMNLGVRQVHGEKARCLEAIYPGDAQGKYYAPRVMVCLSLGSKLPVQAKAYNRFGDLTEELGFKNTRINVGLTDRDFDPENPDYDF